MRSMQLMFCLFVGVLSLGCGNPSASNPQKRQVHEVIHVSIRPSLLNSSTSVLQLKNSTDQPLGPLLVSFENLDSKQRTSVVVKELEPGKLHEIGAIEGWSVEPNDAIQLFMDGYSQSRYKTYRSKDGKVGIW